MNNLKRIRAGVGLSQTQLAGLLCTSPSYIKNLDNGIRKSCSVDLLQRTAHLFQCTMEELLEPNLSDARIAQISANWHVAKANQAVEYAKSLSSTA